MIAKTIEMKPEDKFVVTGVYAYTERRFPAMIFSNVRQAMGINLWRGHVWLLRDGKRTLLKTVRN